MSSPYDDGVPARDEARTAILDAAAWLFHERGYSQTTIDDVADAIGATKGRVYYYYRSKFDIFLAVYEYGMAKAYAAVAGVPAGDGLARLTAMARGHVLSIMADLPYHNTIHQGVYGQLATSLKARQHDQLAELNTVRLEYEAMFREVVVAGMTDGSIRSGDPKLTTRMLLASLNSVDNWFRSRPEQDDGELGELAERIVDLILCGVAAGPRDGGPVPPG